jgi:RNA polymerase sigma-70 factor (ECF subfamily)
MAKLIDGHAATLRLYARQWCLTPEDAVQDAFCKLVKTTQPDDPVAWLYITVKHAAIDRGISERRRAKREECSARPEPWFEEAGAGLDADAAVVALTQLPDELREVIVAKLWGGLTFDQIGQALGCSVSTAFRRYESGLSVLRTLLGEPCPT